MRYRYLFRRAWQEVSQHRALWWYGLLASLVTPFCFDPSSQLLAPAYPWLDRFVAGPSLLYTTAALASGVVLLGLTVQLCGALGRLVLIDAFHRMEHGDTPTSRLPLQRLRQRGGRVIGITVLLGLPVWALAFVSWLPFLVPVVSANLGMGAESWGVSDLAPRQELFAFALPACLLGLLLSAFLGTLRELAERVCILEGLPVRHSLRRGWRLLRTRPVPAARLWLELSFVRAGLCLALALVVVAVAGAVLPVMQEWSHAAPEGMLVGYAGVMALFWGLRVAVGAVAQPFYARCWSVFYSELGAWVPSEEQAIGEQLSALDLTGLRPGRA